MTATSLNGVCLHNRTHVVPLPPGYKHFQELRCSDCNAWLRFLPRPENIERRKQNGIKLAQLVAHTGLTAWESSFIASLAKQGPKFSPKQQEVFDRISSQYLLSMATEKKGGA